MNKTLYNWQRVCVLKVWSKQLSNEQLWPLPSKEHCQGLTDILWAHWKMLKFFKTPFSFLKTVLAMAGISLSWTHRLRYPCETGTSANQLRNCYVKLRARGDAAGTGKMLPGPLGLLLLVSNGFDKYPKQPSFTPSLSTSIDFQKADKRSKASSFVSGGNTNTWIQFLQTAVSNGSSIRQDRHIR